MQSTDRGAMRVGFIGLGRMGLPIVTNLLRAGFAVTAYDVRPEPVAEAANLGARPARSAAEAAAGADLVGVMVVTEEQMLTVVGGPSGILETIRPGGIVLTHSTILPGTCRQVDALCREHGVDTLEVEVSGFPDKAADGTLTLMVGGRDEVVARCQPYLEAIGSQVFHLGPIGTGAAAKLANNLMWIVATIGVYEGLSVARAYGIDPDRMVEVALASSGASEALRRWKSSGSRHGELSDRFEGISPGSAPILERALAVARAGGMDLPVVAMVLDMMAERQRPAEPGDQEA